MKGQTKSVRPKPLAMPRVAALLAAAASAVILLPTLKAADAVPNPRPWTVDINGQFQHVGVVNAAGGSDTYQLGGNLEVGKFLTDHFEAGLQLGGNTSGNSAGFNNGSINWLGKLNYHISPWKRWDPFVGVVAGASTTYTGGIWDTGPSAGGTVGIQVALTESGNTRFVTQYQFLVSPSRAQDTYQNVVTVGISFRFN